MPILFATQKPDMIQSLINSKLPVHPKSFHVRLFCNCIIITAIYLQSETDSTQITYMVLCEQKRGQPWGPL
jgi:hypothetical protein